MYLWCTESVLSRQVEFIAASINFTELYKLHCELLVDTSSLCIVLSSSELNVPSTHPEHDSTKKRTRAQVFLFCLLNYKQLSISICWCAFDAAKPFEPHTKKILWQMLPVIITIIEDWVKKFKGVWNT